MSSSNIPYGLFPPSGKTICPSCLLRDFARGEMWYLAPLDPKLDGTVPAFWVCRRCGHMAQVGVGPVEVQIEGGHEPMPHRT
jgi:hypothetical protein